MIRFKGVNKAYTSECVPMRGVNLEVAKGEVVVVNEKFGIRLTDIVSPADRVKRLAE